MFGAIWALIAGGAIIKDKIEDGIINEKERLDSLSKGDAFYYKTDGCARLHSNGHRVMTTHLNNGDFILKDLTENKILRNYTIEKSEKYVEQQKLWAKQEGKSTYCCWYDRFSRKGKSYVKYCENGIAGSRFKDYKTNNIYVIRKFYRWENPYEVDMYFYIDINTYKVVRPLDYEKKINKEPLSFDEYMMKEKKKIEKIYKGIKQTEEIKENIRIYLKNAEVVYKERQDMDKYVKEKLFGKENVCHETAEYREMIHKNEEVSFTTYNEFF